MGDQTLPIGLVQAAAAFALHHRWDVTELLESAGVSPLLLAEGRARVTESQVIKVVQTLWDRTDDELFGLGQHPLPRGSFRLLTYALLNAEDLQAALERFQSIAMAIPGLPRVRIEIGDDSTTVRVGELSMADPGSLIATTASAVLHRLMSWAIGTPVPLRRVWLGETALAPELYRLIFAAPVEISDSPGIEFDSQILTAPLVRDEAALEDLIATSPRGLLRRPIAPAGLSVRVHSLLSAGLAQSRVPAAEEVAQRLSMSPQTMRRRLAQEGTSLRSLRDELLRDEAINALVSGGESVADLAGRLGFSEPSAFTRAFRRWTGSTPGSYRRGADA